MTCPTTTHVAAICEPTIICPNPSCEWAGTEANLKHGDDTCPGCGCEVFGGDGREDRRKRERFAEDKRR